MNNAILQYNKLKQLFKNYSDRIKVSELSNSNTGYMVKILLLKKMKTLAKSNNMIKELKYIEQEETVLRQKLSNAGITIKE